MQSRSATPCVGWSIVLVRGLARSRTKRTPRDSSTAQNDMPHHVSRTATSSRALVLRSVCRTRTAPAAATSDSGLGRAAGSSRLEDRQRLVGIRIERSIASSHGARRATPSLTAKRTRRGRRAPRRAGIADDTMRCTDRRARAHAVLNLVLQGYLMLVFEITAACLLCRRRAPRARACWDDISIRRAGRTRTKFSYTKFSSTRTC
eukprot:SAG31_NODE_1260_length_9073_cov_2.761088_5_plen_205_part_00